MLVRCFAMQNWLQFVYSACEIVFVLTCLRFALNCCSICQSLLLALHKYVLMYMEVKPGKRGHCHLWPVCNIVWHLNYILLHIGHIWQCPHFPGYNPSEMCKWNYMPHLFCWHILCIPLDVFLHISLSEYVIYIFLQLRKSYMSHI